jgi:L-iditol 2-dehydrogenase
MKAAVYHGPNDIRVEDVPIPAITEKEILIEVLSASVCGTDLRIFHGNHRMYPEGTIRIPGHEVVGKINKIGSGVKDYSTGQRVFVAPNTGCGHCKQCISGNNNVCKDYEAIGVTVDGGFAEYMRVPEKTINQGNVILIDEKVDPAIAALIEPFACVLRGQNKLRIVPGDIVLIIGAGPIGVMHAKLAKLNGAGRVIVSETITERAIQVRQEGADLVVNPKEENILGVIGEVSNEQGVDVIIVAAPSHAAQELALELASIGGRINFFGGLPKDRPMIQFNSNLVHYKELIVTGTTACSTADCWQAAKIVNERIIDLSNIVSERYQLDDIIEAFTAAENRRSLKIVIEP